MKALGQIIIEKFKTRIAVLEKELIELDRQDPVFNPKQRELVIVKALAEAKHYQS